jgi:hypothetical protein
MCYDIDEFGIHKLKFYVILKHKHLKDNKKPYFIANLCAENMESKTYESFYDALKAIKNKNSVKGILTNFRNELNINYTLNNFINACRELQCLKKDTENYNNFVRYIAHDLGICKFNKKIKKKQIEETVIVAQAVSKLVYINNS